MNGDIFRGRRIAAALVVLTMLAGVRLCGAADGPGPVGRAEGRIKDLEAQVAAAKKDLVAAKKAEAAARGAVPAPGTARFAIPRLKRAPTIDGAIDETEWTGAIGVPMATRGSSTSMWKRRSSVFYLGWDAETLYGAQRLPLREGERLLRILREPKHDNVAPHESSMEFYVDRKSTGSHGSACRWQFMGNASGNRWEREDQYQIGQDFYDWNGEWRYAQRLTPDGKFWEAEFAIPRTTVYQETPLKDGDLWWIGMATNLHRPWTWSGFYGWNIPAVFRDAMPEIRMSRPEQSQYVRGVGFDMTVRNTTGKLFEGRLLSQLLTDDRDPAKRKVIFEKSRPISLAPGAAVSFEVADAVDPSVASGRIAVTVESGGEPLYVWSQAIDYKDPQMDTGVEFVPDTAAFAVSAVYNPLSNYVRTEADIFDYARAAAVAAARCSVRRAGGGPVLAEGRIGAFPFGKGETRFAVPADLAPGEYECAVELLDAAGTALAREARPFVRKDHRKEFPWLFSTPVGDQDEVLPPFEPLRVKGATVAGFRKEIVTDGSGLPARIAAAGVELLRGPVALEGSAGGAPFTVKPAAKAAVLALGSKTRARYRGAAAGGPVAAEILSEWEYDGTCRVEMTLKPVGGKPARLDALRLVIPFTAEGAVNYMANGLNMRLSNQTGLIPEPGAPARQAGVANTIPAAGKDGAVWASTSVEKQPMTVGSFVPFVWAGNLKSGLAWFADNDLGWWPSEKRAAVEIVRDAGGRASLVLNIASEPVELDGPRRIVFGLNVNPVRPYSDHKGSRHTFGFLKETGRWDGTTLPSAFARRYPDNPALNKKVADRCHGVGALYAPYTEMSWADFEPAVADYFREEWNRFGLGGPLFVKSSNDYLVWLFDRWIADCGTDGLYFDNVYNKVNYNTHAGTAYALPDGRIQPGYNLWGMRDHIRRIRGALVRRKAGAPFRICIHNTRFQFAPIMGFADLAMGGEMPTPRGDRPGKPDWMEMHPREFMTVMYNAPLWGYRLSHLYHFVWDSYTDEFGEPDEAAADKVHRGAMAAMLVNGVEFFQGIRYQPFLTTRFQMLKQAAGGDLRFVPGWDAGGLFGLDPADRDLDAAIWRGKNHVLLVVANWSKKAKDAYVRLDFPKLLGRPGPMEYRAVWDFETLADFVPYRSRGDGAWSDREFPNDKIPRIDEGTDVTVNIPNKIRLRVEPHDFRAVLIGNFPVGGTGAGF